MLNLGGVCYGVRANEDLDFLSFECKILPSPPPSPNGNLLELSCCYIHFALLRLAKNG